MRATKRVLIGSLAAASASASLASWIGAPRRLDLARRDAVRLHRLEAVFAEGQRGAARRQAVDAALVRLAELGLARLQHGCALSIRRRQPPAASRRGRPASASASFLSCAIGSCSRISPLKIHTFTPQVP